MSMKNKTAMNLTELAANGTKLDLAIAEVRGGVKVTHLRAKSASKTLTMGVRNRRAVASEVSYNGVAVGKGGLGNLNKVGGIGREMVDNLRCVVSEAKRQYAEDRKAAARDRAALKRQQLLTAIDTEVAEVLG